LIIIYTMTTQLFIQIRFLDVIDILLVSYLLYQLYILIRGTVALNIFIAIFLFYLTWLVVKVLNMELLGVILGQVISVGMIALIIVFQQEIRRFLVFVGARYLTRTSSLNKAFSINLQEQKNVKIKSIANACKRMSESHTGALIVVTRRSRLDLYAQTGEILNATTSTRLLESIFFKNSPLHDGAVIIYDDKIYAARCVLPVSDNPNIPTNHGIRHRAALGITEHTDALAVVVSEETSEISIADGGVITYNLSKEELMQVLEKELLNPYIRP
jgi:diadenylate cyclase